MGDDKRERGSCRPTFQEVQKQRAQTRAKWLASLRRGQPGRRR